MKIKVVRDGWLMQFPVRCFSCGKVLKPWKKYQKTIDSGKSPDQALDALGMLRICCRMRYKGYNPQVTEDLLMYGSPRESRDAEVFLNPE